MTDETRKEIKRLREAIRKSKSPYLKRDYEKKIKKILKQG